MSLLATEIDAALYRDRLLQSDLLRVHPAIRHGFTGRLAGSEPAEGNVGVSAPRDPHAARLERERWSEAAGIPSSAIYTIHQVHGANVIAIDAPRSGNAGLGKADALITATPGVALMTLHADCLPIVLVDPERPAVAAIHAGWRGTVQDVVGETVRAMTRQYGSDPSRILAALGPGMKSCCYEVGDEVVDAWRAVAGQDAGIALAEGPRRYHFDLGAANRRLLQRAGLLAEHIDDPELCTMCHADRWFSHRAQGPETGRFGALIGIAPFDSGERGSWS